MIAFDSYAFFHKHLGPLVPPLARAGITPNQVTVTNIFVSLVAGGALAAWPAERWALLAVPCALVVRLVCNHVDGMLARGHGMQTPLGVILNELADVVADAALYLPLAAVPGVSPPLVIVAVFLAATSEMAGVVATRIGAARRTDGPMGKRPRGLVFGTVALAVGLGVAPGLWLDVLLVAVVALLVLTVGNRVQKALEQARVQ